jgi:Fe-S-cluster-containing hydrogenase component 2
MRVSANRGVFVRAVGVLCIALVCAMGTIQAVHSHPENSTTSHHTCSVCATAHAGVNAQTVESAPVLASAALTTSVSEVSAIFRPATSQFIRPPPAPAL